MMHSYIRVGTFSGLGKERMRLLGQPPSPEKSPNGGGGRKKDSQSCPRKCEKICWSRCTSAPTTLAFVPEALGAGALYLDALWSLLYSSSLHPHLQHSVLKAGVDLALVDSLRQAHAPPERTVTALPDMVATTLLFLIDLVLT